MDSYDTLVVILSVTLAIFLVLGIIFLIYLIRIARRVHEISEKIVRKTAGPAVFSRIVANIVEGWQDKSKKKSKK